jgi:hypothetical protein
MKAIYIIIALLAGMNRPVYADGDDCYRLIFWVAGGKEVTINSFDTWSDCIIAKSRLEKNSNAIDEMAATYGVNTKIGGYECKRCSERRNGSSGSSGVTNAGGHDYTEFINKVNSLYIHINSGTVSVVADNTQTSQSTQSAIWNKYKGKIERPVNKKAQNGGSKPQTNASDGSSKVTYSITDLTYTSGAAQKNDGSLGSYNYYEQIAAKEEESTIEFKGETVKDLKNYSGTAKEKKTNEGRMAVSRNVADAMPGVRMDKVDSNDPNSKGLNKVTQRKMKIADFSTRAKVVLRRVEIFKDISKSNIISDNLLKKKIQEYIHEADTFLTKANSIEKEKKEEDKIKKMEQWQLEKQSNKMKSKEEEIKEQLIDEINNCNDCSEEEKKNSLESLDLY